MNLNKILLPAGALAALLFLGTKAKAATAGADEPVPAPPSPTPGTPPSDAEKVAALRAIALADGSPAIARLVEKIYRLETANFTSGGYRATLSPGQKAFSLTFPFGWPKRGTVASDYGTPVRMVDKGEAAAADWVVYKSLPVAMGYLAQFLRDHNGNAGRWNTTDPAGQARYAAKLVNIATPLTDAAWAGK